MNNNMNNKKNIIINAKQYINSFISQPFFIWNRYEADGKTPLIPQYDQNGYKLYDDKYLFVKKEENKNFFELYNQYSANNNDDSYEDDESEEDGELEYKIWEKILNDNSTGEWDYSLRSNKTIYSSVLDQTIDYLINSELSYIDKSRILQLSKVKSAEDLQNDNLTAFANDQYDLLIDPTIIYKWSNEESEDIFYLKATFFAFDKITRTAYINKYKDSNSVNDYLTVNWIYHVAKLAGINIKNFKMILFDSFAKDYKKGVLDFTTSQAANGSRSKKAKSSCVVEIGKEKILNEEQWKASCLMNNGSFFQNDEYMEYMSKRKYTFIDSIMANKPLINPKKKRLGKNDDKLAPPIYYFSDDNVFNDLGDFGDFSKKVDEIIKGYYINKPIYTDLYKNLDFSSDYHPVYGQNSALLKTILFKHVGDEYLYSNNIKRMMKELNADYVYQFKNSVKELKSMSNYFSLGAIEELAKYFKKDKRYIWYDYEGVSSITPIIDGIGPYRQITNQVSIIETINGEIIEKDGQICQNIVKDPLNISLIDIVDNILAVYSNKADYYVVYNKTYENTRNKEIAELVVKAFDKNDLNIIEALKARNIHSAAQFKEIVDHINTNTLDLRDFLAKNTIDDNLCFAIDKIKLINRTDEDITIKNNFHDLGDFEQFKLDSGLYKVNDKYRNMYFYELLGKESIKNIEKLITYNQLKPKFSEYFKQYKNLDVKNGSNAMEVAINRYLGLIKDNEWAIKVEQLKEYCQNDVVAMLVTFSFFKEIIQDVLPEIANYEYQLLENQSLYFNENSKIIDIKN